eukprot:jgi/Tetstr1/464412/TSEL_009204.t1
MMQLQPTAAEAAAVEGGDLSVMQRGLRGGDWALSDTCARAARAGQLAMVQWMIRQGRAQHAPGAFPPGDKTLGRCG